LSLGGTEREFFIDNLLVRIHYIIVIIKWTGLAPWEFEFPFPGSLTSTFLDGTLSSLVGVALLPKKLVSWVDLLLYERETLMSCT